MPKIGVFLLDLLIYLIFINLKQRIPEVMLIENEINPINIIGRRNTLVPITLETEKKKQNIAIAEI